MPAMRYPTNLDTLKQKLHIHRKLGSLKACKYFELIRRFLGQKIDKRNFDRLCISTIGRENVHLHNHFIISILKSAGLPNTALPRQRTVEGSLTTKTPNGCNNLRFLCKDRPHSIRKCRTPNLRGHRFKVGPSPLGLPGKSSSIGIEDSVPKIYEQQSNIPLGLLGKSSSIGIETSAPKIHEQQSNILLGLPGKSSSIGIEDSAPKIHEQQSNIPLGLPRKSSSIGSENSPPKIHEQQSNILLGLPGKSSSIGIEDSAPKIHERQSNIPLGLPKKSSSIGSENSPPKIHEQQSNILLGLPGKSSSIGIEDSAPKIHKQQSNIPLGLPGKSSSLGSQNSPPKINEQQSNILLGLPGKSSSIGIEDSAPKIHGHQSNIPLGLPGKSRSIRSENSPPKIHEQQSNIDLHYVGSRLPVSVDDGGRVGKDSEILAITRSPIRAPLAIPTYNDRARKVLHKRLRSGIVTDTCQSTGQLPDTQCLTKRLKKNLETEGLEISADAANLMNNAVDVYLKRLIKPCLDLAATKSVKKISYPIRLGWSQLPRSRPASSSISDFRTAIELNPTILGENWPQHFEEICLRASEE